jgi:hypothetical protein
VSYCSRQQKLFEASRNNDLTLASRYVVDASSVTIGETSLTANLVLSNADTITSWTPAASLQLTLEVYPKGVMRTQIKDLNEADGWRFQVSDTGAGVEWEGLVPESLTTTYTTQSSAEGVKIQQAERTTAEYFDFSLQFSPFRIQSSANDVTLVTVNNEDTLFFESGTSIEDQSISLGYFVNAQFMYGIPSRANTFLLNTTNT